MRTLFLITTIVFSGAVIQANPDDLEGQIGPPLEKRTLPPNQDPYWENKITDGFGQPSSQYSTRGIEIYNGELYIGTESFNKQYILGERLGEGNNFNSRTQHNGETSRDLAPIRYELGTMMWIPYFSQFTLTMAMQERCRASDGGELWKYNSITDQWTPIISNAPGAMMPAGFGNPHQIAISSLKVFSGKLYAGTWGPPLRPIGYPEASRGCQVWCFDGVNWEQVAYWGFGDSPYNVAAWTMELFNEYLYVGTMNWDFTETGGAQIYRTNDGTHWERVMRWGFREFGAGTESMNTYIWQMAVYNNQLYAGTFNSPQDQGAQLWRTSNGIDWSKVSLPNGDGFGEVENYGIRGLKVYNNKLYVGTAANAFQEETGEIEACEIWRYDGYSWHCIIGEEGLMPDGFDNSYNKYAWSMYVCNNMLYVGTQNYQYLGGTSLFDSQGCEIWSYSGTAWTPRVKNGYEQPSGFGDTANVGARSMIEYPLGSGKLFIGTFNFKSASWWIPENGCDVWRRIP